MEQPQVGLMDCGDGYRRHDNGSVGKGPVVKTADYTVQPLDTGTLFSNLGALGAVIFTLPTPKKGMWFGFAKETIGQNLVVKAPSGVKINGGTAAQVYKNTATTEYATLRLVAVGAADYFVEAEFGTWSNAAS